SAYSAALSAFDLFIVSTRALARRLSTLAPAASVAMVPNALSQAWVAQGKLLYRQWQPIDGLVIRYFSGSPSHDHDFASIAKPLARFVTDHPSVRVEIVGPLNVDLLSFPEGRLKLVPHVSYEELPRLLASSWVNLAPLASSEFTECKSAIKFLESGAFSCPTL